MGATKAFGLAIILLLSLSLIGIATAVDEKTFLQNRLTYWLCLNNTSTDCSGNGFDYTTRLGAGAIFNNDPFVGYNIDFANNDLLWRANDATLNEQNFTLAFWVKPTDTLESNDFYWAHGAIGAFDRFTLGGGSGSNDTQVVSKNQGGSTIALEPSFKNPLVDTPNTPYALFFVQRWSNGSWHMCYNTSDDCVDAVTEGVPQVTPTGDHNWGGGTDFSGSDPLNYFDGRMAHIMRFNATWPEINESHMDYLNVIFKTDGDHLFNATRLTLLAAPNNPPTLVINDPPDNSLWGQNNISINYTVSTDDAVTCAYRIDSNPPVSLPGCNNFSFIAVEGNNNINVNVTDTLNQSDFDTIDIELDTVPPTFNASPPNGALFNSSTVIFVLNASDINPGVVRFYDNRTGNLSNQVNITPQFLDGGPNIINITYAVNGTIRWFLEVFDEINNKANSSLRDFVLFKFDPPPANITVPDNATGNLNVLDENVCPLQTKDSMIVYVLLFSMLLGMVLVNLLYIKFPFMDFVIGVGFLFLSWGLFRCDSTGVFGVIMFVFGIAIMSLAWVRQKEN